MIALVDTDLLIDVAIKREPFADFSSQVLDLAEQRVFRAFIAWHSIANFYYIVAAQKAKNRAKDFISDLLTFVEVAPTRTKDAVYATSLNSVDFEDDLQIAAKASSAEVIVTRNVKHYKRSPIRVQSPQEFIRNLSS